MGYKSEINYIVKSNSPIPAKTIESGTRLTISKEGCRNYLIDCALDLADQDWNIIAKCRVINQRQTSNKTIIDIEILIVYDEKTSTVLTYLNKISEAEMAKTKIRKNTVCPKSNGIKHSIEHTYLKNSHGYNPNICNVAREHGVVIAYVIDRKIEIRGAYIADTIGEIDWGMYNKIRVGSNGKIETTIRHQVFHIGETYGGIVFSIWDLIDFPEEKK